MYKTRFVIKVKTHIQETGNDYVTTLYKDADLPFLPTVGLTIAFDDFNISMPLINIAWNVNENYFICNCGYEMPSEKIGKNEKYKFHVTYIEQEYLSKGWLVIKVDDLV